MMLQIKDKLEIGGSFIHLVVHSSYDAKYRWTYECDILKSNIAKGTRDPNIALHYNTDYRLSLVPNYDCEDHLALEHCYNSLFSGCWATD